MILHHGDVLTLLRRLSAKLPEEESKNKHPSGTTRHNTPLLGAHLVRGCSTRQVWFVRPFPGALNILLQATSQQELTIFSATVGTRLLCSLFPMSPEISPPCSGKVTARDTCYLSGFTPVLKYFPEHLILVPPHPRARFVHSHQVREDSGKGEIICQTGI